jgi:hypothetical protein
MVVNVDKTNVRHYRGLIVIPKSNDATRQKQNLDLYSFELSSEEMESISSLDKGLRFNDPVSRCFGRVCQLFSTGSHDSCNLG